MHTSALHVAGCWLACLAPAALLQAVRTALRATLFTYMPGNMSAVHTGGAAQCRAKAAPPCQARGAHTSQTAHRRRQTTHELRCNNAGDDTPMQHNLNPQNCTPVYIHTPPSAPLPCNRRPYGTLYPGLTGHRCKGGFLTASGAVVAGSRTQAPCHAWSGRVPCKESLPLPSNCNTGGVQARGTHCMRTSLAAQPQVHPDHCQAPTPPPDSHAWAWPSGNVSQASILPLSAHDSCKQTGTNSSWPSEPSMLPTSRLRGRLQVGGHVLA